MPKGATHMRVYDGDRCYTNEFGLLSHYTGIDCVYYNDNSDKYGLYETVGKIEIDNHGSWEDTYCANYILYNEGLYRPYSQENLKAIKGRYETSLDYGLIHPINGLYSDEYQCKMICKDIIKNHKDSEVCLAFVMDYDYCESRWEKYLKGKKEYAVRGRITCDDIDFTTECEWDTRIWILFDHIQTELKAHGVEKVSIDFDMDVGDKNRMEGHLRWGNLRWDKFEL